MTGRHAMARRPGPPRWVGLTILALFVVVFSFVVAPLIASADVMPPGPPRPPVGRVPVIPCAAQTMSWGSLPKSNPVMAPGPIIGVRTGQHACYDRLVVDVRGPAPGFAAHYVATVTADPSGRPLVVPGGARLEFVIRAPTIAPVTLPSVDEFTTLRSIVPAGSFEGITTVGVGVRAVLPFRVFVLAGTGGVSHVVLDVAHRWAA